jgi:hypothetical protein
MVRHQGAARQYLQTQSNNEEGNTENDQVQPPESPEMSPDLAPEAGGLHRYHIDPSIASLDLREAVRAIGAILTQPYCHDEGGWGELGTREAPSRCCEGLKEWYGEIGEYYVHKEDVWGRTKPGLAPPRNSTSREKGEMSGEGGIPRGPSQTA